MSESKIPVGTTGKDLRTFEQTTTAGTVHTEAVSIVDPDNVDEKAAVVDGKLATSVNSSYLFSEYQASLADGEEIVSGWLDMETVDKWQGEFGAGTAGLTQIIESSSDPDGTGFTVDSTTVIDSTFQLFNVIVRQRYLRIRWQNNTGSPVSGCYAAVKATYGSSDKLSVFPVSIAPTSFSQAALVQSITRSFNPNGEFISTAASGPSDDNFTQTPLGAGGTFTGEYIDVRGQNSMLAFAFSDEPLNEIKLQWSSDGINPRPGLLSESDFTASEFEIAGFYIYLTVVTTLIDEYVRLEVTNGAAPQVLFETDVWVSNSPYSGTFLSTRDDISALSSALLVRAVPVAQQPDGDYVNAPADGSAFSYNTSTGDSALLSGETVETPWLDTDGFKEIELYVSTDATGTVTVDFTEDANATTPVAVGQPTTYVYSAASIAAGQLREKFGPTLDGVKFTYETDDDQGFFVFDVILRNAASALPQTTFSGSVEASERAIQTRGAILAPNTAGQLENIGRGGEGESLNTHVTSFEPEIDIAALDSFETGQVNVGTTNPAAIPGSALTSQKTLSITNTSADNNLYWGGSSVTVSNGDVIFPLSTKDLEISAAPYVIMGGASGTTNDVTLGADTVDSSSGLSNPSDMYTSNDVRCDFDAEADTATLSGFDGTGGVTLDVQTVRLVLEGRKEAGAANETVGVTDNYDGTAAGYTDATSLTISGVGLDTNATYIVSVARRDDNADVTNVTSTMGFSGWEELEDTGAGAASESRTTVIRMLGTPTSAGTITAQFDTGFDHAAASVTLLENVADTITTSTDTFASTASSTFSGSLASGTENGLALFAIGSEITTFSTLTTPASSTEQSQTGSTTNNDQSLSVVTAPITATGSVAYSGTMSGTSDVTVSAIAFEPSDAADPVVVISHSEGSTTLTATLTSETDAEFTQEITGDATWTAALLDTTTVTITPTTIGNAAAQIDYVGIEVVEASDTTRITYAWVGDA